MKIQLNEKTKTILSFILRFGLSAILLIWLYKKIDFQQTAEVLKTADVTLIFYGFLVFMLINLILLVRWIIYIKALKLGVPVSSIAKYFFVGLFGNLFLPSAIGGDLIKTLGLCMYTPEKAKVVASVLLDRLSGFAGMAVVAIVSFAFGHSLIKDLSLLTPIVIMAAASVLIGVVLFNEKIYSFCCRIFSRLPKVQKGLMQMHYDIALLKGRQYALYQAVFLSCAAQILGAVVFFYVAKALNQDIKLIYLIIFMPLICVAASMPSIGGLGVREAGVVYLFGKVGIDSGISLSISLINFLFMVVIGLFGGLMYAVMKIPKKDATDVSI